ncbi:YbaB/EbfC family nucleoid-associated protein [bacterium]|nr:YbaB/EbfC family nucleoid-associated protein [bacterium]
MAGIGKFLKQAQRMQKDMAKIQAEMANKTVEATAGGGMVTVIANGNQEITGVKIEKEVVDPDDIEMLENLVIAAINEGLRKSKEMVTGEMSKLTGGLNIPGLTI